MSDINKGSDNDQTGARFLRRQLLNLEDQEVHRDGEIDDAFLFAVAKNPTLYNTLSDAEAHSIEAWVLNNASASEIDLARMAVRKNLAAKELVLSLHLEQAALMSPPVPRDVSEKILGLIVPKSSWSIRGLLTFKSLQTWHYAGIGAVAAAALVLVLNLNQPIGPSGASFQVANLSDRSVLGQESASLTRGLAIETPADPSTEKGTSELEFSEVDVPKVTLQELFGVKESISISRSNAALVQAIKLLPRSEEKNPPRLIFDSELETAIKAGIDSDLVTLRVYDLTTPINSILLRQLALAQDAKSVFITLAP